MLPPSLPLRVDSEFVAVDTKELLGRMPLSVLALVPCTIGTTVKIQTKPPQRSGFTKLHEAKVVTGFQCSASDEESDSSIFCFMCSLCFLPAASTH